jgi:hypothetical protein
MAAHTLALHATRLPLPQTGVFHQKVEKLTPQQQMLADPSAMSNMMKNNLGMMVPQMLTMAWVNFFFSGFIVARVPFPLTQRFRGMLQRGVDLPSLDVTYVSSLSWYFLNVFGLRGVLGLALGEATVDDTALMQQQMAMVRAVSAVTLFARVSCGQRAHVSLGARAAAAASHSQARTLCLLRTALRACRAGARLR